MYADNHLSLNDDYVTHRLQAALVFKHGVFMLTSFLIHIKARINASEMMHGHSLHVQCRVESATTDYTLKSGR